MHKSDFLHALQGVVRTFRNAVTTDNDEWTVKGFVDVERHVYTLSADTKVISKVLELQLFPHLAHFARQHKLTVHLAARQNFYPDISFVDAEGHRFALDLKSTYRLSTSRVNGMTLGAFTGYFRARQSTKNVTFPYGSYAGHFVLGIIYSKVDLPADERARYRLDQLAEVPSVAQNFQFFVQEKYRVAADRPGSGNTKNIGAVTHIETLINGKGPFADYGEAIFDDYWMHYMTRDMARAASLEAPPYHNLETYLAYRGMD